MVEALQQPDGSWGALIVSCGQGYFAVGCWLRNSVDVLTYQGEMVERIYRSAEVGIAYPFCCMDAWNRLWITDGQQLDVYQVFANRVEHLAGCTDFPALVNEGDVRLEDCFKVDRQGLLWTANDETHLGIRVTF